MYLACLGTLARPAASTLGPEVTVGWDRLAVSGLSGRRLVAGEVALPANACMARACAQLWSTKPPMRRVALWVLGLQGFWGGGQNSGTGVTGGQVVGSGVGRTHGPRHARGCP